MTEAGTATAVMTAAGGYGHDRGGWDGDDGSHDGGDWNDGKHKRGKNRGD
jgi:hypothetical protein